MKRLTDADRLSARRLIRDLVENSDDYHASDIDHTTFHARGAAIWAAIDKNGAHVRRFVMNQLSERFSDYPELSAQARDNRFLGHNRFVNPCGLSYQEWLAAGEMDAARYARDAAYFAWIKGENPGDYKKRAKPVGGAK